MSRRQERLNGLLREGVSNLILRQVKDPRLGGLITITSVDTSPDLRQAKIYVSVLGGVAEREEALEGLRAAASFLRRSLASYISLRRIPDLLFLPDTSLEVGDRVLGLLRQTREIPPGER